MYTVTTATSVASQMPAHAQLSVGECRVFVRRRRIIADSAPRTVVLRSYVADWLIYMKVAT